MVTTQKLQNGTQQSSFNAAAAQKPHLFTAFTVAGAAPRGEVERETEERKISPGDVM